MLARRQFSTLGRRLVLGAGVATVVASITLQNRKLHLDGPSVQPSSSTKKLSIYPSPEPEILLIETHSDLERGIGVVRQVATAAYREGKEKVQGEINGWIDVEHAVEKKIKELISPEEPVSPGILYVGVATLTGSVITRNRSLPIRFFVPTTFLMLSLPFFLPKTSHNISEYLSSLEQQYFPAVAEQHAALVRGLVSTRQSIEEFYYNTNKAIREGVHSAEAKVQDVTGIKLHDEGARPASPNDEKH